MITALEKIKELLSKKDYITSSEIEKLLDDKNLSKEDKLAIQSFIIENNIDIENDDEEREISDDIINEEELSALNEDIIKEPIEDIILDKNDDSPVAGFAIEFLTKNNINLDEESTEEFIKDVCNIYYDEETAIKSIIEELEERELVDTIDQKSVYDLVKKIKRENARKFETGKYINDSIRMYLSDIGKIPLYTESEEREIALRIKTQRELIENIESKKIDNSLYDLTEEKNKLKELEKEFATHNLRLVVSIARRFCTSPDNLLDLIQEGNLGLQKAVEKYDIDKGFKFSTYATWWIKQSVTRSIADHSRTIRIPVHLHEKIGKLKKAERELTATLGRTPTNEELAEVLGETLEKIDEIKKYSIVPVSIDSPINTQDGDQDSLLVDFIPDNSLNPEEETMEQELQNQISKLLNLIEDQRSKRIIIYRFGLYNKNLSEEELEATRLRYIIATIPLRIIKKLPEPIMEDIIRNTTTRNIDLLKTHLIKNLPEDLKNKEMRKIKPDYINKLSDTDKINIIKKMYGDLVLPEELNKNQEKIDFKIKEFLTNTNLEVLRRKCEELLTDEEKGLILTGMSPYEKKELIENLDTSNFNEDLLFAKKVIDIREGRYRTIPEINYADEKDEEEQNIIKNIIYNDPYNDVIKNQEDYLDVCLIAKTYYDSFNRTIYPSTLMYVKDKFQKGYLNVFGKFQQGNVATLEDIGIIEDVTRERIRQIEAKTLRKLKMKERKKVVSLREYINSD